MRVRRVAVAATVAVLGTAGLAGCGTGQNGPISATTWGVPMTQRADVPGVKDATSQRFCAPDGKVVIVTRSLSRGPYRAAFPAFTGNTCDFQGWSQTPVAELAPDPGFGAQMTPWQPVAGIADAKSSQFCGPDGKILLVTRSKTQSYWPAYPTWTGDSCSPSDALNP